MSLLINKYPYQILSRSEDETGARTYVTPSGNLPSVTTILSKTKDTTFLDNWRKRIGKDNADFITKEAAALGTILHSHMENHVLGLERPGGTTYIRKMAKPMADTIIENAFSNVQEIWGIEKSIYMPGLYAGTIDLCGIYDGKETIMDYKNTRKMKKEEWIEDYYIQCTAYALAHNELYGTNINQVAIFMVDRACNYKTFSISGNRFEEFKEKWICKLEEYYS